MAADYLSKKGYKILERNYRFRQLELDILAMDKDELVVVEVKTRQTDYLAGPEVTVTKKKQRDLVKAANAYILEKDMDVETRFDIISIILNQYESSIDHIEDAFYPTA